VGIGQGPLEDVAVSPSFWSDRRIVVTGHTGFKGSWLCLMLRHLGAQVTGYSLPPPTTPNLYTEAAVADTLGSVEGDVRDVESVRGCLARAHPEVVFHLAAQSLVRRSYAEPLATYSTNVLGTANVLEACRNSPGLKAVVIVTTDKCYLNREWVWGYREDDALGGYDPYSSSKAAAELVTAAYRQSFFNAESYSSHGVAVASARAGNVVGGGDWAEDRLIPDAIRAFSKGEAVALRNPQATRPWQHVLDPVSGYLVLAERLIRNGPEAAEAWNFGPWNDEAMTVGWVMDYVCREWQTGARWVLDESAHPHEGRQLRLDCSKAVERLGWRPRLSLTQGLDLTLEWYKAHARRRDLPALTRAQIKDYLSR
jgi:CDP-glucose 4,6-dehydratase